MLSSKGTTLGPSALTGAFVLKCLLEDFHCDLNTGVQMRQSSLL